MLELKEVMIVTCTQQVPLRPENVFESVGLGRV